MAEVGVEDVMAVLREAAARLTEATEELGRLDGAIGDGDHGTTMARGFAAILRALNEVDPAATDLTALFALCAGSFLDAVGATAGPLYASGLLRAGAWAEGRKSLPAAEAPMLLVALAEGIGQRGKAAAGDKTMMDVWLPVAQAARTEQARGTPLAATLADLKEIAAQSAEATRSMTASRGRAARLGARSLGHVDPGAASAAILVAAFADVLALRAG
ncbi:dihydroxyacetone kinase subunit DhaL [Tropicimonas sp. IMCC6043]|uniref:dihydroxyacetone kinase subunit DhaL n=1 Tax=Tropicimonas sp. IMCC6043 TaxID=2510645 RepID=UPI0013ED6288|nr:dihydroxyacetone kinase subunit DhaL [Tropicimonas sp. IMCC6043]